ncbi:MAG: NAD(P)H-dependent oxidoreductase [Tepidiformaceae bacterium]
MVSILLLYDSRGGLTEQLADSIAEGIASASAECVRRRIEDAVPADMLAADGMIVGSPNWSGLTGKLKDWFDYSGDLWESGELAGKLGAAFTAGYSRSGGIEVTLLQILHLLFAHGMVVVGLPWSEAMRQSGSYYGVTAHGSVTELDRAQARALGKRVAELASRLTV